MKKIGELLKEISNIDEAYEELLSQHKIKTILNEFEQEVDMSKLPSFITSLNEYIKGSDVCSGCMRITSCRQPIHGHYPKLEPHLGRLRLTYTPCDYYKSELHLNHIQSFHMPKTMVRANFETWYAKASRETLFKLAFDFIKNYHKDRYEKGIYLYGAMGTGKTYAMCAIANELAKRGISCAVVYFPELIAGIKASFKTVNDTDDTVEKLKNIPVLMLDDIGSESVTSWMRDEILGRILNHRMMYELPTFFTSNFNLEQLQSHYAQTNRNEYEPVKATRILERIKALAIPVELVGKNYRRGT